MARHCQAKTLALRSVHDLKQSLSQLALNPERLRGGVRACGMAFSQGITLFNRGLRRDADLRHSKRRNVGEELFFQLLRYAIRVSDGRGAIHLDTDIGEQAVPEPARLGSENLGYALNTRSAMTDFVHKRGVDAVQHSGQYRLRGLPDNPEDRNRNQKANDRVGKRVAKPDAGGSEDDGEAGQAVGAGVIAVRDQRGALDLAADADAKHRDRLVAEETDEPGDRHPEQLRDGLWMDEAVDRLVPGNQGAEQDDKDDDDASQVLDFTVAIGERRRRLSARQHEGDPERDGRCRIPDIMDGVGQERDRA